MKTSPYYPPRAGTWSRFLTNVDRLFARIRMSQVKRPSVYQMVGFSHSFAWLLIPGLMWRGQAERAKLGNGVMLAWAACVVIYMISLNGFLADVSVILASAMHGISAAAVLAVLYPHWAGFTRVWKATLYSTLLVFAIYNIGLRNVTPSVAERITFKGETVMIHPIERISGSSWTRGEWVSYRLPNGMLNMDRILAGPGETIRFHKDSFEVNGKFFERVALNMPSEGEKEMDELAFFIWPSEATYSHGGVGMPDFILGISEVPAEKIEGRPYQRWLWKSTTLEKLKPIYPSSP